MSPAPSAACPGCATVLQRQQQVGGPPVPAGLPVPGAVMVCAECGSVSVFDQGPFGAVLRVPTDAELEAIFVDGRAPLLAAALLRFRAGGDRL